MKISVTSHNDIHVEKDDLKEIKTPENLITFIENAGIFFVKLSNYADGLEMNDYQRHRLNNIKRNAARVLFEGSNE